MTSKATLSNDNLTTSLTTFLGTLQRPKWEIDKFTRLGGSKLITQKTRLLSNPSQITATFLTSDYQEAIRHYTDLLKEVGNFFKIETFGETFDRVLLQDMNYNLRATSGPYDYIIEYQFLLQVEAEDE